MKTVLTLKATSELAKQVMEELKKEDKAIASVLKEDSKERKNDEKET